MRTTVILCVVALAAACSPRDVRRNVSWGFTEDRERTTEQLNRESETVHEEAVRKASVPPPEEPEESPPGERP